MSHSQISAIGWFNEVGLKDRPTVGGKGASLGELTAAGIRVPPGFVVTTAAFEQFLAAADKDGSIRNRVAALDGADLPAISTASDEIRARIEQSPLPGPLHEAITHAYGRLCDGKGDVPVAVRSSATSEDSEEASFAGLQDTFLWVRGADQVVKWVRTCWASLYSTESISYRLRLKLPEDQLAMGVVVQQMVDSLCSGVMFTRSPTTGDRSVVTLEGSWGLGSSIVSGEVTPDKYVISKVTGEIANRAVAAKTVEHVPVPDGGVSEQAVPEDRQNSPCLSDDQIAELVGIAKRVEQHYGCPQDIEWAVARDNRAGEGIYLLQSRPETVWAAKEVKPVATPKARPFDHVIGLLGGQNK